MIKFGRRSVAIGAWLALSLAATSCTCAGPETTRQASRFKSGLQKDDSGKADYLVNFGVVALGDRKVERATIENTGNRDLVISAGRLERPFSHDIPSTGLTIGVGASRPLAFTFEPLEETEEPVEIITTLNTNENNGTTRTVRLVGHGKRAQLVCDPAELSFGAVPRSSDKTVSTVCTNLLGIEIEVQADRFRGNYAQFFSAEIRNAVNGWVKVPANGTMTVDVTFRSESVGINEATLELKDAFNQSLTSIPVLANAVNSTIVFEPETCLDFSYVGVGESATQPLLIRTVGDLPVQITRLDIPEDSRENFSINTSAPLTLSPDGTAQELEIVFHPSSSGPHQTQIEVYTDDPRPEAAMVTACAKGFGGGPAISCNPRQVDFGMVAVGMPVRRYFECTNSGMPVPGVAIDPLVVTGISSTADVFTAKIFDLDTQAEGPKRGGYKIGERFGVEVVYSPTGERFDDAAIQIETISAPDGVYETMVSGQGRALDPCDFTVDPPALRFGIVDRGDELTLSFGIINNADHSCLINDLRITSDVDGVFSVEPIESMELLGRQTLKVPVTFAPTAYKAEYTAAVEFQISNPDLMNQRVNLRGTSARPCISIEPRDLDFGKVGPGCTSREVFVTVSNVCGTPVEVKSFNLNDSLDSDAFQIRRRPALPRTLHAHEREEFTMVFAPSEVDVYDGSIIVEVTGSEAYISTMKGEAVENPIQTDTFDQKARPKVDVLWVMDNSGSFSTYQDRIAVNLPAFLDIANQQNVDYHIAVTTSGLTTSGSSCPGGANGGEDGRFFPINGSHPRILTPTTPDLAIHWAHNMRVGTCHGTEPYVEAAYRALSEPLINETKSSKHNSPYNDGNAGFLRREASLSIIFVADEAEQSTSYGKSIQDYLAFFKGLKGHNMLRIHGITGSKSSEPSSCNNRNGDRFHVLISETDGTWLDICTPTNDNAAWEAGLKEMSEGAFGFLARFVLRGTPADQTGDGIVDEKDIELRMNGNVFPPVSPSKAQRWTYDPNSNAIDFTPLFVPKPGSQLTATYKVACSPD